MMTGKPAIPATVLGSLYDSENSDSVPAKPPDRVLQVTEGQGAQGGRHSRAESPGRRAPAGSYCFANFRRKGALRPADHVLRNRLAAGGSRARL